MSTLAELERKVLQLPEDQRVALLHRVLKKLEPSDEQNIQDFWEDEIVKRIDLLDSGQTQRISASEVFRELDQKLT